MKTSFLGIILLISCSILVYSQNECYVINNAFAPGEEVKYLVRYNWRFIWVDAGVVTFKVFEDKIGEKPCYYVESTGTTLPNWDWFFKVRDKFETWIDAGSLLPYRFKRDCYEGDWIIKEEYYFIRNKGVAYSRYESTNKPFRLDTIPINNCVFDVLSAIYYVRCLDYSKYKKGDTIPITLLLDEKIENIFVRYQGKEKLTLKKLGTFNCIKITVYLVEGTIFHEGEGMTVWATDDENRIPLLIDAPILVGSIKATPLEWKGIRNPITSKIK